MVKVTRALLKHSSHELTIISPVLWMKGDSLGLTQTYNSLNHINNQRSQPKNDYLRCTQKAGKAEQLT